VDAAEPVAVIGAGEIAAAPSPPAGAKPSVAAVVHGKPARPPRHRRRHEGEREHRHDRPQREREQPPVKRFERRDKAPDPNSPFAKLAALKAQLEADAKERR
jgi:ATP-dependent RNA helicase SUPV3L1/SUV3